jgi:hypothetical protein
LESLPAFPLPSFAQAVAIAADVIRFSNFGVRIDSEASDFD